jgi:hypothetical protein
MNLDATDLLELFLRYAETEHIAAARVHNADVCERQSIDYFQELVRRWQRFGVYRPR